MNIFHISAECYPIAKIGGLADVVGALPKYQANKNVSATVLMPFYNNTFTQAHIFTSIYNGTITLGHEEFDFRVLKVNEDVLEFPVCFVDVPELLYKNFIYSYDDAKRFLAFQIACLYWLLTLDNRTTIIHCHDYHTGLIPFMAQECYKYEELNTIPVITTIHNAQYQGWFNYDKLHLIPKFNNENSGLLDWDGQINPLAAAIKCAWRVTTVSPTYMEELKQNANGLETLLSNERNKCIGILNGIDTKVWNPETDSFIFENFSKTTVQSGRAANKKWICDTYNLDINKPLFAFIGRLVGEKGADLLPEALKIVLESKQCNVLVLGSGEKQREEALEAIKVNNKGLYNTYIGYDEKLSHIIYAGTDFLLMPSRVEPCGLNQMYALRYGAIPIVRSIGGLKDTVIDISNNGFGICFNTLTVKNIVDSIFRGIALYENQNKFKDIRKSIMTIDHSWDKSAKDYLNLYQSIN